MAYQAYPYHAPVPSYGHPQAAPGPSYYSAPPAQHYQPPPSTAGPSHDPFRMYYADRLRELTFNSRPLIQELSILAMQQRDSNQWANMTAVVEEIEGAVYRSPPHEKLPKLYLLDSISKNVGAPYTTHLLQATIPRLYIRTHREVDGVTKIKMEEMISLWRRSGPGGTELYSAAAREAVEREIFGAGGPGGGRMHVAPSRAMVTRESVLSAIHSTIGAKQGEAAQRAWDQGVQTQLRALMGLSEMLNTRQVQPAELQQIMDQLRGMGYGAAPPQSAPVPAAAYPPPRAAMPPFPPVPSPVIPNFPPTSMPTYPPSSTSTYPAPAAPALPPFAPTLHGGYDGQRQTPPYAAPVPLPAVSAPTPAAAPVPLFDANMLSILNSLTGSGGLGAPKTPEFAPAVISPERAALADYEDTILGMKLSLRNLDLNTYILSPHTPRSALINRATALPLEHLPIQCSQCAARFPCEGEQINSHMDWHARRNKQERTSSGRGAHRRWLPRAEEWVNDLPVAGSSTAPDTIAGSAADSTSAGAGTTAGAGAAATAKPLKSAEELQKKWVRVPSGPGAAGTVCPICKDGFKREWSESEEEWVWRNAIDVSGKIMHATCRQQQLTANRLARVSKGRSGSQGTSSKSPGMTPEAEVVVKAEPHPLSHEIRAMSGSATPTSPAQAQMGSEVPVEAAAAGVEVMAVDEARPAEEAQEAVAEISNEEKAGEAQEDSATAVMVAEEQSATVPSIIEPDAVRSVEDTQMSMEPSATEPNGPETTAGKRKADEEEEEEEERKRVKVDSSETQVEQSVRDAVEGSTEASSDGIKVDEGDSAVTGEPQQS